MICFVYSSEWNQIVYGNLLSMLSNTFCTVATCMRIVTTTHSYYHSLLLDQECLESSMKNKMLTDIMEFGLALSS